MHFINPSSPNMQDILVARCETLADAEAMARWIVPVLAEWPASAWHFWVIDATGGAAPRAAKVAGQAVPWEWRDVDYDASIQHDAMCKLIGGHTGLVVLAHHVVAAAAARKLEGLVPRMTVFAAEDPLAYSFHKPLASYGIKLAA